MKILFFFITIVLCMQEANAQGNVGIGTNNPHPNAMLDIRSSGKGILIPRVSAAARTAMTPVAKGMLVYDSAFNSFYYHDGSRWRPLHEYNADSALTDLSSNPQVIDTMRSMGSTSKASGILYDNGGPAGNYAPNSNDEYRIEEDRINDTLVTIGYKFVIEELSTESPYDSLEIFTAGYERTKKLISGSGIRTYFIPYTGTTLVIRFQSNGVNQLPGFKIRWTKLTTSRNSTEPAPLYGWYYNQRKNAVRGGFNIADEWNTDSIGVGSFGFGGNNHAIADGSAAFGVGNRVSGRNAFTAGINNTVTADQGIALGSDAKAGGLIGGRANSIAIGRIVSATEDGAIVIGDKSLAGGSSSVAIGTGVGATNTSAVAIGEGTLASGQGSMAFGKNSSATGTFSVAIGALVTASGLQAVAIGAGSIAAGQSCVSTGYLTRANGNYSFTANRGTVANGVTAAAFGDSSLAAGNGALAAGYKISAGGASSMAIGYNVNAAGLFGAFATGYETQALGTSSFAANYRTSAGGYYSFAAGESNNAAGHVSTVLGYQNTVNGFGAVCIGASSVVNGYWSRVLGSNVFIDASQATGIGTKLDILAPAEGAFGLGDYEPGINPVDYTSMNTANQFVARFRGGYYFMTTANAPGGNINNRRGVVLLPGQSSWSMISDMRHKENFEDIDGETLLEKIAAMRLTTWNYIGQDPKTFRHYGPMAQDFYNAFGKDKHGTIGCDTLINQQDFLGVSFAAIQALEKRTAADAEQIKWLKQEVEALKQNNEWLIKKLKASH